MTSKTIAEQLMDGKPGPDQDATLHVTLEAPDGKKISFTYHQVSIKQWAGVVRGLELITEKNR